MTTVEAIRNKNDIKKVEAILAKQNQRNLLFFTIGTNCGLRISDILSLNVGDVKGKNQDEPLFLTIFGNRLERVAAYYIIKDACKKAGLEEKIGTHTLRKTFGYHHYKRNKDVAILQKIFNHSSPEITLRYIGIEQDEIDESYQNFIL